MSSLPHGSLVGGEQDAIESVPAEWGVGSLHLRLACLLWTLPVPDSASASDFALQALAFWERHDDYTRICGLECFLTPPGNLLILELDLRI